MWRAIFLFFLAVTGSAAAELPIFSQINATGPGNRIAAFVLGTLPLSRPETKTGWKIVTADHTPAGGVEYRHLTLQSAEGEEATLDFAIVEARKAKLQVVDNAAGNVDLAEAMARSNLFAGTNGGYFDPQFRPLGLRIIDGKITSPLTHARLLTGVVCGSTRGIEIARIGEFSAKRKCDAAIECGPFLVDRGAALTTLDRSRSARRTFAFVTRDGKAALGVASDLSLAQLAAALATPDLKVTRALNLDGGSSTAFWCRRDSGNPVSMRELKNVRDFIGLGTK